MRQLGVDQTSSLAAKPEHPAIYATGLVDLDARIVIRHDRGQQGC